MAKKAKAKAPKQVEALRHTGDKRVNIPTAEHQNVLSADAARQGLPGLERPRRTGAQFDLFGDSLQVMASLAAR